MRNKMNMATSEILSSRTLSDLRILSGQAWVTIEGDDKDYILSAGEKLSLCRGKHIVIQSLRQSEICIELEEQNSFKKFLIYFFRGLNLKA